MKVLISGASGFVGSALVKKLQSQKHEVFRLVRKKQKLQKDEIYWNPENSEIEAEKLTGFDAVIHLAGENVFGRWTEAKKRKIYESRVHGTLFLSETLSKLKKPPKMLLSASAIGIYGNRGDEILDESSQVGKGFLAETAHDWESATRAASDTGIRVIHYRISLVLSSRGGAMEKILPPFKMGVGGKLGKGQQWMSWISLEDLLNSMLFCLENEKISGPVNACAPEPVQNETFTHDLGKALHRPTLATVPEFALKLALGEMAEEALLSSIRVIPKRLLDFKFPFQYPKLPQAIQAILQERF